MWASNSPVVKQSHEQGWSRLFGEFSTDSGNDFWMGGRGSDCDFAK